ncbi:MAG TPA: iron-binding protein [Methanoregulaceae archaeon]|nr:iron-binding protein [Methanoregulaceae archaeon]
MTAPPETSPDPRTEQMKITVSKNGPYIVTGGVPLTTEEICVDDEGYCRSWKETKTYPLRQQYALCRCGHSKNRPFCDGTHAQIRFDGTEAGDREPFLEGAEITRGPSLTLADNKHLCIHAGFCHRAAGIWNLVKFSDSAARETAIEEACDCPTGRLVVYDNATGEAIGQDLEKSIAVIEDPDDGEYGPLWVRGGIPVISADGTPYEVRQRVTLCQCGRSKNRPFCDGSHTG